MYLLKKDDFEFSKILANGYQITENEPNITATKTMANGSIRRNYGLMPKTNIKIKFARLTKQEYETYLDKFSNDEDTFTYYSPVNGTYLTKKFYIKRPKTNIQYIDLNETSFDELEIELEQIDEVE